MKQAMKKSMRRGAVILGVTALLGLFCSGCGGNRQAEQSGAASLSGETLIEIGPGEIAAAQTKDPADTQASQTESSSTETLPESTQMPTEPETEAVPEETSTETEPETPEETTPEPTQAPETKPGLWAEVPTDSADWATRATSDVIYYLEDFGFTTYVSPYDEDGDGIEDQADILQGAKDYVATRPVYDTGYFAGGWPPEGKGVCSDVAAYALLAAGYNLQDLVDADVKAHPEDYNMTAGDADRNIDYRRTRNLLPFFEKYGESLTLNPYDYEAWQPGDIVIFSSPEHGMWPGHIAVVSDRRASDGLPYLIHHTNNDRFSYEEDYLTTPQRIIVGHFRVSAFEKGAQEMP